MRCDLQNVDGSHLFILLFLSFSTKVVYSTATSPHAATNITTTHKYAKLIIQNPSAYALGIFLHIRYFDYMLLYNAGFKDRLIIDDSKNIAYAL